ncbi:MAG TPA: ABC transporter permease [Bacteroidota bacterium]|nr:ABC transporter permease [Bacteroidota bacterium]
MLRNYFKIASRNLIRHKVYSLINVVGLAVGMACAVLIMLWVNYELSYDEFHKNADRLYRVAFTNAQKDFYGYYEPGPLANYLKDNFPEVEQSTSYSAMSWKVSHDVRGFFCKGGLVDSSFFRMFTFPLEEGNPESVLAGPASIVISRSLAQKLFGHSDPVGQPLTLNDKPGMVVTGVFSDVPSTSQMQFDFVIPFSNGPEYTRMWDRKSTQTYVLLRADASPDTMNKKISGVMDTFNPTWKNILFLFPMTKSHLYEPGGGGPIVYVYIFSAFGFLILVVACINFMNLSTARSEQRLKEIGIKKTVGSSRMELARQFMTESMFLSFVSLLIAVVLVELSLPALNDMLGTRIAMTLAGRILPVLLGIAVVTGLLAGSYPAIYLSSFSPMTALSGKVSRTGEHHSSLVRNALVVAQFSFSVFMITCILFIGRQLRFMQAKDLGFNKNQVLMISTRGALLQNVSRVKDELLKYPFVQSASVSATDFTGFEGAGTGPIDWEGKATSTPLEVGFNFVDEDFAETFQVKMEQGRFFSKQYPSDMSEAFVVNEEAAKEMGITDPLGRNLTTWFGRKGRIVGVIHDFNTQSLREEMAPIVLVPTRAANYLCVRLSTTQLSAAMKSVEKTVRSIVPDDPFEYRFLDDVVDNQYKTEQRTDNLAAVVALMSIFLSCLGLFGLASYKAERRTKEIGIRKVLGASIGGVLALLTMDFIRWILIANLVAWPAAWYVVSNWLQGFAYRIPMSWSVFVLAGGLTILIAFATVSWQVIRAATANPIRALRYE